MVKNLIKSGGALLKRSRGLALIMLALVLCMAAQAQTDATAIVTSTGNAFTQVATLCVTIGTFFTVYRLAKRVR